MKIIQRIEITLTDQLFQSLLKKTGPNPKDINKYITKAISAMTRNEQDFENSQFSGKIVSGKQLLSDSQGWFNLGGITYRYHLIGISNNQPNSNHKYEVVGSKGNVIFLKQL